MFQGPFENDAYLTSKDSYCTVSFGTPCRIDTQRNNHCKLNNHCKWSLQGHRNDFLIYWGQEPLMHCTSGYRIDTQRNNHCKLQHDLFFKFTCKFHVHISYMIARIYMLLSTTAQDVKSRDAQLRLKTFFY